MILASSSLSSCSEFIVRHPGLTLVLLGVVGEVFFDWKEMRGRLAWGKRLSAIVLIAGLLIEFREAAESDIQVEQLRGNNLVLAANVEELRRGNMELTGRVNPRLITTLQREKFLKKVANWPKSPVGVVVGAPNGEADNFASQIRSLLNDAGYGKSGDTIVRREAMEIPWSATYPYPSGMEIPATPIFIAMFTTNANFNERPAGFLGREWTNSFPSMSVVTFLTNGVEGQFVANCDTNDVRSVPCMICTSFEDIGIFGQFIPTTDGKAGECFIFVSHKFF